jgi:hypothetical protein
MFTRRVASTLTKKRSHFCASLQMHAGITDLTNTVLNQLRKACAAAAASSSGAGAALLKDSADGFPDINDIYGGDNGPSIQSIMEVRRCGGVRVHLVCLIDAVTQSCANLSCLPSGSLRTRFRSWWGRAR